MPFLGLMTVRAHEAAVREWDARCASLVSDRQAERETVARLVGKNTHNLTTIACLKQEVEGLRSDVRQAEAAHDKAVAELAHWKKHGQLRDPATGRLIPKPKPSDRFTASHSPA